MTVPAESNATDSGSPRPGSHLPGGHSAQKGRTRRASVDAAARLVSEQTVSTVAQAAERVDVSRATAQRHLPTQGSLLVEVSTPLQALRRVRLFAATALFVGPEPIVVMQTVSRLPRDEAIGSPARGATTLVRAQLAAFGIN